MPARGSSSCGPRLCILQPQRHPHPCIPALPVPVHPPCPALPGPAYRSADLRFDGGLQTIKVLDERPLTGDSLAQPRLISQLPFSDSDVSSRFSDKFLYSPEDPAPAGVSWHCCSAVILCCTGRLRTARCCCDWKQ